MAAPVTTATFDALTERQRDVLGAIAINRDMGHAPSTLKSLVARGLIEPHKQSIDSGLRGIPLIITRYEMPLAVHMAWCAWCSEHVDESDGE